MKVNLKPQQITDAYDMIMSRGTPSSHGMMYQSIEAVRTDAYDKICLCAEGVTLRVTSPKSYHLDFDSQIHRDSFLLALKQLSEVKREE